jgi:hypothetical protein
VGIVSAAGTGLQEVSTQLARYNVGVTQGIGTGGRDLKEEVGGLMMLAGMRALQEDPATRVIVLVSKPPAPSVAQRVMEQVHASHKPTVVCLLGGEISSQAPHVYPVHTLEEAAWLAAGLAAGSQQAPNPAEAQDPSPGCTSASLLQRPFGGGYHCYEAQVIWADYLRQGFPHRSSMPLHQHQTSDSTHSQGHCADLGEEVHRKPAPHDRYACASGVSCKKRRTPDRVILLDVVLAWRTPTPPPN